jgi:[ribosomal protein S5]-alanine N-acetyltransferase
MGVLIGDPAYRGIGVVPEILRATGRWLKEHQQINQVVLGVHKNHRAAIRAYQSVGFVIEYTPHVAAPPDDVFTMVWRL